MLATSRVCKRTGVSGYTRSMMVAVVIAPPAHMVISAVLASRR